MNELRAKAFAVSNNDRSGSYSTVVFLADAEAALAECKQRKVEIEAYGREYIERTDPLLACDAAHADVAEGRCGNCKICLTNKLAECERKLTWLSTPRRLDGELEPIVCPACNGAIDDHRANCKVEAVQELTLWQQKIDLECKLAAASETIHLLHQNKRDDQERTDAQLSQLASKLAGARECRFSEGDEPIDWCLTHKRSVWLCLAALTEAGEGEK